MDIWSSPVGYEVELGAMPQLPPGGLEWIGPVLELVTRATPHLPSSRLDSLSWEVVPSAGAAVRATLRLVDRPGDGVATLRLQCYDRKDDLGISADLRFRRAGTSASGTVLLAVPVRSGDRREVSYPVDDTMLTHHIPGDPGVLTTPNLIALMEETAAGIVRPRLVEHAAAVGTWIGVRHTGAARIGEPLDVVATVTRSGGRRITFDVVAHVGDRRIGEGQVGFTLIPGPSAADG